MILAITGHAGAGKTTAAKLFARAGWFAIHADEVGHELYKRPEVKKVVVDTFGKSILTNGRIDRRKLKDIVFRNHKELQRLNAVMHPLIIKEIDKRSKGKEKIVVEGAVILEAGWKGYDRLLLIETPEDQLKRRIASRLRYTESEISVILASQKRHEGKRTQPDFLIANDGTEKQFNNNVKLLIASV